MPLVRFRAFVTIAMLVGLAISVPAWAQVNDDCATATAITSLPFSDLVDTTTATIGGGDPSPSCANNDNNVWYTFTATRDTSLQIDTAGSGYDTNISVYTGPCGALTEIACNEDTPAVASALLIVPLNAGQTVLIAVASNGTGGVLQLSAQKAVPGYFNPTLLGEAVLSSDASPLGGSFGAMISATAVTDKSLGFGTRTEGIFARLGGVLTTIATSGDPTPSGGTFAFFGSASMNQATTVAFQARIDGGPAEEGIFSYAGGVLTTVLLRGDPSPDGGTYRKLGRDVVINDDGNIAFLARTSLSGSDQLLLVFDGVTTTIMAAEGDPAPCGGTIRRIGGSQPRGFDLSDTGIDVAFLADASASGDGIYTADGVAVTTIACEGAATVLGGTHQELGTQPTLNSLGEVYYTSSIAGGAANTAVWRVVGAATAVVVADGDVLATGETVDEIRTHQTVATNGAGDVAFTAQLNGIGTAVVMRPNAAALPSAQIREGDACPFGGTFLSLDTDLDLAISGGTGFAGTCDGGTGTFFVPAGGAPIPKGRVTDPTALGTGFRFTGPSANAFAEEAFHGGRTALYGAGCAGGVCVAPVSLVAQGDPLPGFPGQHFDQINAETFNGIGRDQAFTATTAGASLREIVVTAHNAVLTVVAASGQALPGGVGTFAEFPNADSFFGSLAAPSASNSVTAFFAEINHPTAGEGIFAATPAGTSIVALEGDAAPSGDFFTAFGAPFVHKKSIVFNATTGTDTCLYAVKGLGLPIATIACEGDPAPAGIGGTIDAFLAPVTGSYTYAVFAAEVSGGTTSACLFGRKSGGSVTALRCVDDPYVDGQFITALTGTLPNTGPVSERKGLGLTFVLVGDGTGDDTFVAVRKTKLFPLFDNFVTTLPLTGGAVSYNGFAPLSMNKKTVTFAADLSGGTASGAVVVGRVK